MRFSFCGIPWPSSAGCPGVSGLGTWVLGMLSPQGKAGERGLKGQKVRDPGRMLGWTRSSQMPSFSWLSRARSVLSPQPQPQ